VTQTIQSPGYDGAVPKGLVGPVFSLSHLTTRRQVCRAVVAGTVPGTPAALRHR